MDKTPPKRSRPSDAEMQRRRDSVMNPTPEWLEWKRQAKEWLAANPKPSKKNEPLQRVSVMPRQHIQKLLQPSGNEQNQFEQPESSPAKVEKTTPGELRDKVARFFNADHQQPTSQLLTEQITFDEMAIQAPEKK